MHPNFKNIKYAQTAHFIYFLDNSKKNLMSFDSLSTSVFLKYIAKKVPSKTS